MRSPGDKAQNIDDVVLQQLTKRTPSGGPIQPPGSTVGQNIAAGAGATGIVGGGLGALANAPMGNKPANQSTPPANQSQASSTPPPAPPQLGQYNRVAGASTTGADVTPKNYDRMAGLGPLGSPERPFPGGDLGPVRSLSPAAPTAATAPTATAPAATAPAAPTATAPAARPAVSATAPAATAPAATTPAAPRFSGAVTDLAKSNQIANPNLIRAGSTLNLPGGQSYTVAKGDTLSGIAAGQFKGTAPAAAVPAVSAPTPTSVNSSPNTGIDADTRARALASVANLPAAAPVGSVRSSGDSIDLKEDPLDRILKLAGRRKGY
jgi:hypothetical protein